MIERASSPMPLRCRVRSPALAPAKSRGPVALVSLAAALLSGCSGAGLQTRYFGLTRPQMVAKSSYEIEQETNKSDFADSEEDTNTFTQELDIRTRGFAYHPALAVFSLDLRPKYQHQETDLGGRDSGTDELLFLGYSFDSTFLQAKPYTFKLFSSRDRNEFDSAVAADSVTVSAVDRALALLKYPALPTTITVERRATDFDGISDFVDTTYLARLDTKHDTDASSSVLKAEYSRQDRELETSSFDLERYQLAASNRYQVTDNMHLSTSFFGNRILSDDFGETTSLNASEHVFLRLGPNLTNTYQLRYNERREEDFSSITKAGSAELQHELYENLTTTLTADARHEDFTNGELRTYGARLGLGYRRRIPWGSIGFNNGYGYELRDGQTSGEVRDEAHELGIAFPDLLLANEDVDLSTIVVTDSSGLTVYVETTDYIVTVLGDAVVIAWVDTGSIPDGSTVLVDYRFLAQPPSKVYSLGFQAGAFLSLWNALKLSYSYSNKQEHFISGERPDTLVDDTIQRARAELKWRWSTTRGEYEDRDTTRTPLSRWKVEEALSFRPWRVFSVGLSSSYSETKLKDTGDKTTQKLNNLNMQWQPHRRVRVGLTGFLRETRGDVQRSNERGVVSRLRWQYGPWLGGFRYEFARQEELRNDQIRRRRVYLFELARRF